MSHRPLKIGVTGTHSTGKSSLLDEIEKRLASTQLKIFRVSDLAKSARKLGFPILTEHTYESTLWIMAECMRQEAEASLSADVILVDRPVMDALGYLNAALAMSNRTIPPARFEELLGIAERHCPEYSILITTKIDPNIPLGPGRDKNQAFRHLAQEKIHDLIKQFNAHPFVMTSKNRFEIINEITPRIFQHARQNIIK